MCQRAEGSLQNILSVLSEGTTFAADTLESHGIYPFASPPSEEATLLGGLILRLVRVAQMPNSAPFLEAVQFSQLIQIFLLCCQEVLSIKTPVPTLVDTRQMSLFA